MPRAPKGLLSFLYHVVYDSATRDKFQKDAEAVMDEFDLSPEVRSALRESDEGDYEGVGNLVTESIKEEFERVAPPGWF